MSGSHLIINLLTPTKIKDSLQMQKPQRKGYYASKPNCLNLPQGCESLELTFGPFVFFN